MSDILITILYMSAGYICGRYVVYPLVRGYRRAGEIRDELAMARNTIAALAPKAHAWDTYLADRRMPRRRKYDPPLDLGDTRVQYQHLSAECDGCDEPAGAPDVRFQVQHYPV